MKKASIRYLICIITASFSFQVCLAQDYYFKNLVVEKGLSQEDVSSIVQDSYGFIWIGTYDGLNRFDGRNIKTFHRKTSNPASLPDNRISALAEDFEKRLWIGTQAGNFSYYSLLTDKFIRVNAPENAGEIRRFIITRDSTLLALTSNGVLRLNESEKPKFEFIRSSINLHFRDGLQDRNGDLILVGYSGVFLLSEDDLKELPNPTKSLFNTVAIANETILAGGNNGIFTIDKTKGAIKPQYDDLPQSSVTSIISDKEGDIWIGTVNDGLFRFDKNLDLLTHITASKTELRGLLSNTILKLYQDEANNLWIGSRQGLSYTNLNTNYFNSIRLDELYRPNIRSLLIDQNNLFLGITNEGLFRYDLQSETLINVNYPEMNFVNHIEKIDSTIYVSSENGLLTLKNDYSVDAVFGIPDSPSNEPSNVRCVAADEHGRIFIGTYKGILEKEGNELSWIWKDHPFLQVLSQYFVFRMLYDPSTHQLLIGTRSKGLLLLNMDEKGQFTHLITEGLLDINDNLITNTSVWNFHLAKDKTIWLGTDIGLFRRVPGSKLFEQIAAQGVLDQKIMSIAEDPDGDLWLSNTHGLIHYNPHSEKVKTHTYEDGLLSSSMTEASGYYGDLMFFGTTNGLNYFNPLAISPNPYHPNLLISNLNINNEVVKPGAELFGSVILDQNINSVQQLDLSYLQNNFSIDFSATNFSNTSQNNFRYRLRGYDNKWIFTSSNPVISYSNLDPSSYVLELQIEDSEGNWERNSFTLPINIKPALWKTTTAYVIYLLIIGSIVIAFIYFWLQKQRLDHQIELDQVKINQDKELRERQLRFFVDVGHEFKTPLSLILAPFNDLTNENLSKDQKNMCLQIVSRNIDRMNFLVHQLLDLGRISEGQKFVKVTKKDLNRSIREYTKAFEWQIQHENIDLRLNLNQCVGYFDNSVLEKGFYNVLSNAFKYTPTDGIVDISLKVESIDDKDHAIITVSDSGSGIPDDQKSHIFERFYHGKDRASSGIGLHLAHSLIQAHGGSISVEDSELGGAKFKIILPISRGSYSEGAIDAISEEIVGKEPQGDHYPENDETIEKGETILIVEDDYDLRKYLNISLQNDYTILEASNGEQGLFIAQEQLPDIIISDVMMPQMDGIEMCQQLKSNKATSHIPVLFLTAKKDEKDQKEGLKVGAWDYITKPFDSEALRSKVNNILETRNRFKSYLLNHNINLDIESHYTSYDQKLLKNINQVIEDNIANPNFTASELASEVGLSRMHLHRKLKTLAGETAKGIITRVKIMYAVDMFDKGCDRVQEAMNAVGITNYGNFNNNFKKIMNVTASDYIAQKKDGELKI